MKLVHGKKQCARCKKTKKVAEFWKALRNADGLTGWCIPCNKEANRIYAKGVIAKANGELRRKRYSQQILASRYIQFMVLTGKLKKEPCFLCGEKKTDGHHLLYTFKKKVIWLCRKHHRQAHFEATILK